MREKSVERQNPIENNRNIWQGSRVRLRAIEPADWETFFKWDQDTETARHGYHVTFPRSAEAAKQWAQQEALRQPETDCFRLVIETLAGEMVGTISTFACEPRHGTFKYGLSLAPEYQRKGYGSEAVFLLLRFYFLERRYRKVTAHVYSFNENSIRFHKSLGFQLEGTLRQMIYTDGQYWDDLIFGMTAEEFREKHGTRPPNTR